MDKSFKLGGGLELLVVGKISFSGRDSERIALVQEGEDLQRRVFQEQNVTYPDKRVLLAADSVGTSEEPGSLDGSDPGYHHLYLLDQGRLVGMRVSSEIDIPTFGHAILDYIPPLVLQADASRRVQINTKGWPGFDSASSQLSYAEILGLFARHVKKVGELKGIFTDGIGSAEGYLSQGYGFKQPNATISIMPLDAGTELVGAESIDDRMIAKAREDYMSILPEPVHMYGRFGQDVAPKLSKTAARWLFVTKYLKEGYIDNSVLRKIGLKVNDVPAVQQTLKSIEQATGPRGYVNFA